MIPTEQPADEAEAGRLIADAARSGRRLRLQGGGTRPGPGRPVAAGAVLSSAALTGLTLMEPAELVIGARAGTPLRLVEETLAGHGLMLPFEPMDHRLLFGTAGEPTIGAVAAANVSGPRRVSAGAARDHLIGVRFVNGRGEAIKSGGRVMKNVTGLDLVKLSAGALGTLGFLTEVTFKVLPRAEASRTLVWHGLGEDAALALMTAALGSPYAVDAAAHLPGPVAGGRAKTCLRIEGFGFSLDHRAAELTRLFAARGTPDIAEGPETAALWCAIRDCRPFAAGGAHGGDAVWRLSLPAAKAVAALRALVPLSPVWFMDWGGSLVWLAVPEGADAGAGAIHGAAAAAGGHATLVRASEAIRARVPVFRPPDPALMQITAGLKACFDPAGVLNPGRMYPEA